MKRKLAVIFMATALTVLMATAALAASFSPAEMLADLTGKTTEEILQERVENKTFGQIAEENLVLDEFRNEMFAHKQEVIEQKVKEGTLTEEKATEIKEIIKERRANCLGSPDRQNEKIGQRFGGGLKFGECARDGSGYGHGAGKGMGFGRTIGR